VSDDPSRVLSDDELRTILRDDVLPALSLERSDAPRFVILGGPQGSRKTSLKPVVAEQLGMGHALHLEGDDLLHFHPHYEGLVEETGSTFEAAKRTSGDHEFLYKETLAAIRDLSADVMVVGPYTGVDFTMERIGEFREANYRVEMAYTALHPALSQLGVMHRGTDGGMLVSLELQQRTIRNTPVVMAEAERRGVVHALHAVAAEGVAFSKHLQADGTWSTERSIAAAIEEIRARPWDQPTKADFVSRRAAVEEGSGPEWSERLASIDRLAAPMLQGVWPPVADAEAAEAARLAARGFAHGAAAATGHGSGDSPSSGGPPGPRGSQEPELDR
jgi:zeta toxin